jgi:hypothetical protein
MKRVLVGLLVLGLLVSSVGMASAGGRRHHHDPSDAYWWALGAGVALGTLGVFAGRPYYPAYPPVIVTQPRVVTRFFCPVAQAYYPDIPYCPVPWVHVRIPY